MSLINDPPAPGRFWREYRRLRRNQAPNQSRVIARMSRRVALRIAWQRR